MLGWRRSHGFRCVMAAQQPVAEPKPGDGERDNRGRARTPKNAPCPCTKNRKDMTLGSEIPFMLSQKVRFRIYVVVVPLVLTSMWVHHDEVDESWQGRLYSPTLVEKFGEHYFIVDCWHNRIIYSDELKADIGDWEVLDDDLAGPHSIASNGRVLMVDDTERHAVRVYLMTDGYPHVQTFENIGVRPHRVHYDSETDAFYVLGSRFQTMSKFRDDGQEVHHVHTRRLPFLGASYTRSFSIIDGYFYFVSGPEKVYKVAYSGGEYEVVESYPVHDKYHNRNRSTDSHSMNDIFRISDGFYITVTPDWWSSSNEKGTEYTLLWCPELEWLESGECEDLSEEFGLQGFPYYISEIDGVYFIPEINPYNSVIRATGDEEGRLYFKDRTHDFGAPTRASKTQKGRLD